MRGMVYLFEKFNVYEITVVIEIRIINVIWLRGINKYQVDMRSNEFERVNIKQNHCANLTVMGIKLIYYKRSEGIVSYSNEWNNTILVE